MLPLASPTLSRPAIRRGVIYDWDCASLQATVALDGALGVVTLPVMAAAHALADDDVVAVLFFDDANPNDGVVLGAFGAAQGPFTSTQVAYGDANGFLTGSANLAFDGSQLKAAATGSSGGLLVGGDAQWYRGAANLWQTPDRVQVDVGLGIGMDPGSTYALAVANGFTFLQRIFNTNGAAAVEMTGEFSNTAAATAYGVNGQIYTAHASGSIYRLYGTRFRVIHQTAYPLTFAYGHNPMVEVVSSGDITNTAYASFAEIKCSSTGGPYDAILYGGAFTKDSTGSPYNAYGLKLPDITQGAGSNYAIYTAKGDVRLGDSTIKLGFFGATPVVRPAAYTPTNVSADRSYNADSTSTAELADVLGTLIADLQAYGLLQ